MASQVQNFGPFAVFRLEDPEKVWISCGSAKGGEFSRPAMLAALDAGEAVNDVVGALDRFFWENV